MIFDNLYASYKPAVLLGTVGGTANIIRLYNKSEGTRLIQLLTIKRNLPHYILHTYCMRYEHVQMEASKDKYI